MSLMILCTFVLTLLATSNATMCYTADGYAVEDDKYMPCIAIGGVESMCCRLNDTNPDTCLSNGLCFANSSFADGYWRDFCTDQTWESPNCLAKSICSTAEGGNSNGTNAVTACGNDNKYCCGNDRSCCDGDGGFSLNDTLVTIGGIATTTVTATASTIPTEVKSGSSDASTKLAIGLGVGIPLAVLAGAMLGAGFLWGRRNALHKAPQNTSSDGTAGTLVKPIMQPESYQDHPQVYPHEAPDSSLPPSELPGGK
ncbi:hypothetical protein BDW59DRAFT_180221 [Aspergillus cavernicola]|uniref:Mid2 domain-containing protein n=1 Tax=Aspergillus cavernicola TaxID=176166 RepID=A0ABR4IBX7_9EURO